MFRVFLLGRYSENRPDAREGLKPHNAVTSTYNLNLHLIPEVRVVFLYLPVNLLDRIND